MSTESGGLREDVLRAAALVEAVVIYDDTAAERALAGADTGALLRILTGWMAGALRSLGEDDVDRLCAVMAALRAPAYADDGFAYGDGH